MVIPTSVSGDILVAILNNVVDFEIARDSHWYRIPLGSVEKWLNRSWPPRWLAFYQTKIFGREAHAVTYFAEVKEVRQVRRGQLFPDEPQDRRRSEPYCQLLLGTMQRLPQPILSRRCRRIIFIQTTWEKFIAAVEINDLFDESPLEDRLWAAFKRLKIAAERQEYIQLDSNIATLDFAALDFAIYCLRGRIDVETDGDSWHANPERAALDNRRDNALKMRGWTVLRFNTTQVWEQMTEYCIPTITKTINNLGGVDENGVIPRRIELPDERGMHQKSLFDES